MGVRAEVSDTGEIRLQVKRGGNIIPLEPSDARILLRRLKNQKAVTDVDTIVLNGEPFVLGPDTRDKVIEALRDVLKEEGDA